MDVEVVKAVRVEVLNALVFYFVLDLFINSLCRFLVGEFGCNSGELSLLMGHLLYFLLGLHGSL